MYTELTGTEYHTPLTLTSTFVRVNWFVVVLIVHVARLSGSPLEVSVCVPLENVDPPVNFKIENPGAQTGDVAGLKLAPA